MCILLLCHQSKFSDLLVRMMLLVRLSWGWGWEFEGVKCSRTTVESRMWSMTRGCMCVCVQQGEEDEEVCDYVGLLIRWFVAWERQYVLFLLLFQVVHVSWIDSNSISVSCDQRQSIWTTCWMRIVDMFLSMKQQVRMLKSLNFECHVISCSSILIF